jgi:DNA-binding CsgD family transcriptional regulator
MRAGCGEIVGREPELAVVHEFLERGSARALVVTGDPGIGKTTLWEAALGNARERGFRVLSTRASSAEARLSHAALIDLLDGVDTEEFAVALPGPQLYALEVALLRAQPVETPVDSGVALGLLNALRALSDRPLVLAIDDVQWLDAPSVASLAFAGRRLEGDGPLFLLARRPGRRSMLERALEAGGLDRLEIGALSYGAIRQLLSNRLGLVVSRRVLRRLVDTTLGNPLFALEVGRGLAVRGAPAIGEDLPVPDAVEGLLGTRVARLPAATRTLLLATALSANLTVSQLGALVGPAVVEEAVDDGLLVVEGDRVRPSHPLLAAAAKKRSRARTRRDLHAELAEVVGDSELRARHLALAAERPDEGLASIVAEAAATAFARGAREEAVELAEHALRLTPAGSPERTERLLALAEDLSMAGQERRLSDLLTPVIDTLPSGVARARAHFLLSDTVSHVDECMRHLEAALAEGEDDSALRARTLARMSTYLAVCHVARLAEADAWAREARTVALDSGVELDVLHALAWTTILRGRAIDDLRTRLRELTAGEAFLLFSVERAAGVQLAWRGAVAEARLLFRKLAAVADERGEEASHAVLRFHLCELALRAGEWDEAGRLLDDWLQSADRELLTDASYQRCLALLAAGRGDSKEAEPRTASVIAGADATGLRWNVLEALRARGVASLVGRDPRRAAESLRSVWEHTEREGVDDPGAFPAAPDLVEALVELGELGDARAVAARLRRLAAEQEHPWGLATASRCDALVELAGGAYDEQAALSLAAAVDDYDELGLRFDGARSLLALGRAQRRHRKWGAARASLERAVAAFDEMGSPGWAEEARSELGRIGARRPRAAGQLTPTEERVVELAATGLSNKEIARTLVVTVNTVETHLSHAYVKLGVRSRAQLSRARFQP